MSTVEHMSNQDPSMENDGRLFTGFLLALVPTTMAVGFWGAGMGEASAGKLMFGGLFAVVAAWLAFLKK